MLRRRWFRRTAVVLAALVAFSFSQSCSFAAPLGNLSPAEALRAFETEPGFVVELVAAEPLTIDPVALAFDERGRLFVAEDRDYPTGSPDGRPLGKVACLEDTDGDGRMDRRTDFATGLRFPNGVMCWRGGVIVTAAPDVYWLCDKDGDGRAEVRELLLTGFDTNSTSQLRANDPTLGPDGWVYLAGGLRGGKVVSPKHPGKVVDTERGDLRFRPDTGEVELVTGKSQFGLAFDDAGNRFACMNRIQTQHAPIPSRYLARNPHLLSPGSLQDCPEISANSLMTRYTAGAARYYPISDNLTTADSHYGTYSAACAVHIYRGTALPWEYRGAAFSCDPTGNLVRGDRLEKVGGTFAAHRIREGTEALRSRDNWFRPVFLADGPDGALYIADMYRKTIEHPEYLPAEVRRFTDFESGRDQGRIWRLTGGGAAVAPKRTERGVRRRAPLADMKPRELITQLDSDNPWNRDTAFRLLLERRDANAPALLQKSLRKTGVAASTVARLRLLDILGGLDERSLTNALEHPEPEVRQNAVLLAESRLANERLHALVMECVADADPHVRFQAALSLGEGRRTETVPALARLAAIQSSDRWTRAAILSSLAGRTNAEALLREIVQSSAPISEGVILFVADLGRQIVFGLDRAEWAAAHAQLSRVLESAAVPCAIAGEAGFSRVVSAEFPAIVAGDKSRLDALLAKSRTAAADGTAMPTLRSFAIELLAFDDSREATQLLTASLGVDQPLDLQRAATRALVQTGRKQDLPALLSAERWNGYTPGVRAMVVDRLAGNPELAGILLEALENDQVAAGSLTSGQRDQLRKSKNAEVRSRAEGLFSAPAGDRQQALAQTKAALALKPAPANGRGVFEKNCAICHRFNHQGIAVGPDLFDIRHQPKEAILFHIVIPEAEIAPNFVNYECELRDGRTLSGLLAAETSTALTFRMAQGVEESVVRSQVARLTASRLSLMPQELEKAMSLQDVADLLGYLRGEE